MEKLYGVVSRSEELLLIIQHLWYNTAIGDARLRQEDRVLRIKSE